MKCDDATWLDLKSEYDLSAILLAPLPRKVDLVIAIMNYRKTARILACYEQWFRRGSGYPRPPSTLGPPSDLPVTLGPP